MVRINASGFREALETLGTDFVYLVGDALELGVDAAARDAFATNLYANHTWKLRSATRATINRTEFRGNITNSTKYASFVENGTKPHIIRARRARFLRFFWTRIGENVAFKQVKHPGTKPRPFFKHAGEVGGARIHHELVTRFERATGRFNQAA